MTHNTLEASLLADRIVVLAGRPARIETMVEVEAPRPDSAEDPAVFQRHRLVVETLEKVAA